MSASWDYILFSGAISALGFKLSLSSLRRVLLVENNPTAKVRSAPQGYVNLIGTAVGMAGKPVVAPLSQRPCCWYSYRIHKWNKLGETWKEVEYDISDHPFLLRDSTGDCIIDPEGADVTASGRNKAVWYGDDLTPPPISHASKKEPSRWTKRYRFTETRIHAGERLYTFGKFKTLDELDHIEQRNAIAQRLLFEWKHDKSAPLLEFDHNRNGRIDPNEWQQARKKAQNLAMEEQKKLLAGKVLHTLSATNSDTQPFLISTTGKIRNTSRTPVIFGILVFFAFGILTAVMLASKFGN